MKHTICLGSTGCALKEYSSHVKNIISNPFAYFWNEFFYIKTIGITKNYMQCTISKFIRNLENNVILKNLKLRILEHNI